MNSRLSVRLDGPHASRARQRRALATLSEHFQIVDDGPTDIALWAEPGLAAADIFVVEDPLVMPILAAPARAIPCLRFAPRIFAEPLRRRVSEMRFSLIDSVIKIDRAGDDGIRAALLEQLAALRALGAAARLTKLTRIGAGYLAQAALDGRDEIVTLSGVASLSAGPAFTLHAASVETRFEFEIDDAAIARPARARLLDGHGVTHGASIHQTSDRLTWLYAFVAANGPPIEGYDVVKWRADLDEIDRIRD
jgi:hypothetical protein